ncbi:hypothetical protein [Acidithrix sp. C25]|uniref:hypothetical protein n=1 Tax=Acidithrix sp. C25 TaxID=1671482 RepID=UPI00191B9B8A|nr:hypothetical protein [Acidithrix sp. C25]
MRVLHYQRTGPVAEIAIEKIVSEVRCPMFGFIAHAKERPLATYIDLPFGGTPTRIKWKKLGWYVSIFRARREAGHLVITVLQLHIVCSQLGLPSGQQSRLVEEDAYLKWQKNSLRLNNQLLLINKKGSMNFP